MEALIITLLFILIFLLVRISKLSKLNAAIIKEGNEKITNKNEIIKNQKEELQDTIEQKDAIISLQQDEIESLSKYQPIIDIELEVERRREESNIYLAQVRREASEYVKSEREKAKRSKELAEKKIEEAHILSTQIIEQANTKAEEIAGDAYEAKNNAKQYEATVKAMENIIRGYGDEYLIPGESLLDKLAEEYDHTEAGRELSEVRLLKKSMIKNGTVADCDYVEPLRRISAIDFVIDAFNGKVDTIMSKVKHNNYGKLLQQLKDAYSIVNHNGRPFKNAKILSTYYNVVEKELKLAVTVSELKKRDKEEQRAIREAMREEERARREYEKALKESQREERLIAKALKEAEARVKQANDKERAEFQRQLEKLQIDLDDAIARGQRALSMAQQTKMGHVYIISNIGSFGENIFKIGLTRRLEPLDRVKELGDASVPFPFDVHAMIHSDDAPALERELQSHFKDFQVNKINPRKEFFDLSLGDIKAKVKDLKLETHWTMKAEALEYRESLQLGLRRTTHNNA